MPTKGRQNPDDIAKKVRDILDPPARPSKRKGFEGTFVKADAYYELEAVIQDIKHGCADKNCIKTLERVQKQIVAVLEACK